MKCNICNEHRRLDKLGTCDECYAAMWPEEQAHHHGNLIALSLPVPTDDPWSAA